MLDQAGNEPWLSEGQHRFHRSEQLNWGTSRRMRVAPEGFDESETLSQALPTLPQSLQSGGRIYHLEGTAREEALATLVDQIHIPNEVDPT